MAKSGYFQGTRSGTRPYLRLYWDVQETDISGNRSYVRLRLYLYSDQRISFSDRKTGVLDGTSYTYTGGMSGTGYKLLSTKYVWVGHNSDGTKSRSFSGNLNLSISWSGGWVGTLSVSGTARLDTIPRQSKITSFSVSDVRCTQFKVSYSVDRAVSEVQYQWNGGTWYNLDSSGIVANINPGSTNTIRLSVKNSQSGLWSYSSTKTVKMYALSTAKTPNFNLGNSLSVSITRATSSIVHDVYLEVWYDSKSNGVAHNTLSNVGTSATLTPTSSALNTIYGKRPSHKFAEVRLRIVSRWGSGGQIQGTTYTSWGKANIVNANPSIASVSYKDTNTTVQGILGNNQRILRNLSTLQVTAGLAKSQKGATLKSYKVTIGGSEYTASASGTEQTGRVINVGKVNQSGYQTAVLTVIDSRGNTASRSFTVLMINYLPPQFMQASADRLNNYEKPTTMNIEARRSIVKPASTDVNNISLRYRIKENPSGSYGNWINLTTEDKQASGLWQSVAVSQYMADYPNNKSYTVEIGIRDKFTGWTTISVLLPEGIALLRFLQDRVEAGVPICDQESGQPYIFFTESEEW